MIERKFSKSFDECLQQAYLFHDGFLIDETEFSTASPLFAPPFATNFLADIESADAIPTNEDDLNEQTLLTQAVEATMESAREHYQKLLLYISLAWPNDKAIAKAFGKTLYERARNNTLRLINLLQDSYNDANSTTYKAGLIAAGFTQAGIDLLNTLADELTTKNRAQEKFMKLSAKRSEERIVAFNKVWDTMVKLSDASKIIFKNSPAKIEYYKLYPETPISNPPEAPVLEYAPGEFYWDEVPNATSYQLVYRASDETEWTELYAGPFPEGSIEFNPGDGEWIARLRARNAAGYGDWSEERTVFFGLRPPQNVNLIFLGAPDNHLRLSWTPVIGADTNDIYKSVVATGQPAGTFTLAGSIPTSPFEEVATLGMRTYYYIIAKNAMYTSEPSDTVYYNVPV